MMERVGGILGHTTDVDQGVDSLLIKPIEMHRSYYLEEKSIRCMSSCCRQYVQVLDPDVLCNGQP